MDYTLVWLGSTSHLRGVTLVSKTYGFHCCSTRANSRSQDRTAKSLPVRLAAQGHKLVDGKRHDETFDLSV
jgi:hypothetical protein